MNISQAAKLTGLSAKQIRDYEKRGLLKAGTRTLSGYRYYEENDLTRLRFIRHSRDVGFSPATNHPITSITRQPESQQP